MTLDEKAFRRTYLGEVVDPTVDVEVFLFVVVVESRRRAHEQVVVRVAVVCRRCKKMFFFGTDDGTKSVSAFFRGK